MGAWSLNTGFVGRLVGEYRVDDILIFTDKIQAVVAAYCEQVTKEKEEDLVQEDTKQLMGARK